MYIGLDRTDLSTPVIHGLGLFDSGFDLSTWGVAEWGIVALGAYTALKMFGDVKRTTTRVRKSSRSRAAKAKRRDSLQKQLASL